MSCKYVVFIYTAFGSDVYAGMLFDKAVGQEVFEVAEHRAVVHVVTVHDSIKIAKIGFVLAVEEYRTDVVFCTVPCVLEIIIVVRVLQNGIVDVRVGNVYPTLDLGRDLNKRGQVDAQKLLDVIIGSLRLIYRAV